MKKIIFAMALLASFSCYGQSNKSVQDTALLKNVHYAGRQWSHTGKYYTEIYEVLTDTLVHRFGLRFLSADSSFVKKVPMDGINRRLYDQMKADMEYVSEHQEEMRKETIDMINRHRTSPEVWLYFEALELLGK